MVTVAVDAGWGEDFGQPIKKLEGREAQGGAAGEVGPRQDVEDLVGAVVNEMKAVEGKGPPGAITNQSLKAGPVGGFDPDAPVQTESTPVIPAEHILGVVGLEEAMALKMPEDPGADRVLEALDELGREGRGFVEAEGFGLDSRILASITLDPLEESIDHAEMKVKVRIQRRAEAMEEADGSEGGGAWSCWTGLPESGLEGPKENMKDGAGGSGSVMKVGAQALGDGQDPLAHRDVGKDVVHQVSRGLGHALGVA
jgi:hypothetical protein